MKFRLYKSKKVIYGCAAQGEGESPYLTRYLVLETKRGNLLVHKFHRSDAEESHDHPWKFWTMALWPGYQEIIPHPVTSKYRKLPKTKTLRRWPLIPAYRPATWRHRVQLLTLPCWMCLGSGNDLFYSCPCSRCEGTGRVEWPCWTVVWTGPKFRRWGFFTKDGFVDWMDYFRANRC